MTLQALWAKVGDDAFFAILRAWYAENRNGNVTTDDVTELAERIAGTGLSPSFDAWLVQPGKPVTW